MHATHPDSQRGIALISALLVMLLMSSLLAGFAAMVMSDIRLRSADQGRSQAFYVAHAGLEKLTSDVGTLFAANFAPTGAEIDALETMPPVLPDVTWTQPDGTPGYLIDFPADPNGNPLAQNRTILSGPYQGFIGLVTPYDLTVTARLSDGSEASLTRAFQTVSIPVFQFGIFSEATLSFFPGPVFNFGGRVHTNDDLFLASGNRLVLSDRVTAVGEVVRTNLSNGWPTSTNYTGRVEVIRAPGIFRDLQRTEGSLVGTLGSAENEPTWTNLSTGTYNHNIVNGRTGARRLDLPIVSMGAQPVDIIKRPAVGENVTAPNILSQRYFVQASLRILLSDTALDITSLPTVTAVAPVPLGNLALTPVPGYVVDGLHPPFAVSAGPGDPGYLTPAGTPSLGGFIKIDMQDNNGVWTDVTTEILNLGIAGRNLTGGCGEPNVDAIVRLQRLRDNPVNNAPCGNGSTASTDYWPNVLYDAREGAFRDNLVSTIPRLGGAMHYIEIDVRNLSRWFTGAIPGSGVNAENVTGYTLYISDRRGNRDLAGVETGEYGFEDIVNPADVNGMPNGVLDVGEDINANGLLDTYGQFPAFVPPGAMAPLDANARPWTMLATGVAPDTAALGVLKARVNPALLFRRAVKLTNGSLGNIVAPGLSVISENPVYVEGNWNANNGGFGEPNVATAVMADSVTLLSQAWTDLTSWNSPHVANNRNAVTTWYRLAIISGKHLSFPQPPSTPQDFGTDGGTHNFLRYVEDWSGQTLNYRGSIANMATSRQAIGLYKCCTVVYRPPTRGYNFDTDFLQPSLLPPKTPMFRDVNTTGFSQIIRPR